MVGSLLASGGSVFEGEGENKNKAKTTPGFKFRNNLCNRIESYNFKKYELRVSFSKHTQTKV